MFAGGLFHIRRVAMTKVDLITGFLGSGKTTFIRKYVEYLASKGENICILENDYGAINVDTMLLSDMESKCDIEMVAGGCDYDCHRRRFRTKMITMAMLGYTRVIIEPSGIFDMDEFFDTLHDDPLCNMYEINNIITIVKADLENSLTNEGDYMLASQIADSGIVLLSRAQEVAESVQKETISHINKSLEMVKCDRQFAIDGEGDAGVILNKNWDEFTDEDFEYISKAGYKNVSYEKHFSMDENGFESIFFMKLDMDIQELEKKAYEIFKDNSVGNVIRVKGFVKDGDEWCELNATAQGVNINRFKQGQNVVIVIGEKLNVERINEYFPADYSTMQVNENAMNTAKKLKE